MISSAAIRRVGLQTAVDATTATRKTAESSVPASAGAAPPITDSSTRPLANAAMTPTASAFTTLKTPVFAPIPIASAAIANTTMQRPAHPQPKRMPAVVRDSRCSGSAAPSSLTQVAGEDNARSIAHSPSTNSPPAFARAGAIIGYCDSARPVVLDGAPNICFPSKPWNDASAATGRCWLAAAPVPRPRAS